MFVYLLILISEDSLQSNPFSDPTINSDVFSMRLRVNGGLFNDFEHKEIFNYMFRKKCSKIVAFLCNKRLSFKGDPENALELH